MPWLLQYGPKKMTKILQQMHKKQHGWLFT